MEPSCSWRIRHFFFLLCPRTWLILTSLDRRCVVMNVYLPIVYEPMIIVSITRTRLYTPSHSWFYLSRHTEFNASIIPRVHQWFSVCPSAPSTFSLVYHTDWWSTRLPNGTRRSCLSLFLDVHRSLHHIILISIDDWSIAMDHWYSTRTPDTGKTE